MRYGTSYFGNRMLDHAEKDMRELAEQGFSYVLLTFSEFDLAFHRENMKDMVRVAKAAGLEVHMSPWGVGNVFGGEPFSNFVAQHYNDACQVLDDGRTVPLACPNAPAFRDYMRQWIDAVIDCNPDAVFWDEPHFHEQGFLSSVEGRWGCRCDYCQSAFKEQFGHAMPAIEDEEVKTFKRHAIRRFVKDLTGPVNSAGLRNILYMTPSADVRASIAHWEELADNLDLDTLATGPYWQLLKLPFDIIGDYAASLKDLCDQHGKQAQLWLQCFKLSKGQQEELITAVDKVIGEGIKDIAFWTYRACEHESAFRCDDPAEVWAAVTDKVTRTKDR